MKKPDQATKPFKIVMFVGCALLGLLMEFVDQPLLTWFGKPENNELRLQALTITDVGLAGPWFAGSLLIYILVRILLALKILTRLKPVLENLRHWGAHTVGVLFFAGVVLHLFKFLVGRQRPYVSKDFNAQIFHPVQLNTDDYSSFPSGHTQTLFCMAFMFSILWPRQQVVFWSLALAGSLTRIVAIQHFPSDVLGSVMLVLVVAPFSLSLLQKWIPKPVAFIGLQKE